MRRAPSDSQQPAKSRLGRGERETALTMRQVDLDHLVRLDRRRDGIHDVRPAPLAGARQLLAQLLEPALLQQPAHVLRDEAAPPAHSGSFPCPCPCPGVLLLLLLSLLSLLALPRLLLLLFPHARLLGVQLRSGGGRGGGCGGCGRGGAPLELRARRVGHARRLAPHAAAPAAPPCCSSRWRCRGGGGGRCARRRGAAGGVGGTCSGRGGRARSARLGVEAGRGVRRRRCLRLCLCCFRLRSCSRRGCGGGGAAHILRTAAQAQALACRWPAPRTRPCTCACTGCGAAGERTPLDERVEVVEQALCVVRPRPRLLFCSTPPAVR